jgi:hypothetical protein
MKNTELMKCVETFKEIRRSTQGDADSCIKAAFDEAIAKLERCATEDDPIAVAKAAKEALAVLSDLLTCLGVAVELGRFFGA